LLPIAWSLALGQAQVLVTLLLAIARPWSVALAGQLKVLPALAAVYWVSRREWAAFGRFALWSGGLMAVQAILQPGATLDFLRVTNLEQVGNIDNLSPYGLSPVLWGTLAAAGPSSPWPPDDTPRMGGRGLYSFSSRDS
jgi:hypothetical protein